MKFYFALLAFVGVSIHVLIEAHPIDTINKTIINEINQEVTVKSDWNWFDYFIKELDDICKEFTDALVRRIIDGTNYISSLFNDPEPAAA